MNYYGKHTICCLLCAPGTFELLGVGYSQDRYYARYILQSDFGGLAMSTLFPSKIAINNNI